MINVKQHDHRRHYKQSFRERNFSSEKEKSYVFFHFRETKLQTSMRVAKQLLFFTPLKAGFALNPNFVPHSGAKENTFSSHTENLFHTY